MELRHLRYFLAVAEELHFTRAAARLGIAQPPLSQQIQQLEREVGAPLFHRSARGVALTEAGRHLARDAREILTLAEAALARARRSARGELGTIRIGFTASASFHPFVTGTIRDFRAAYPDVAVHLVEDNTVALLDLFRARRLDVAFMRPANGEAEGLDLRPLLSEPLVVALPAGHRLAGREGALPLASLAGETFILYPRRNGRRLYDAIVEACRSAGFSPEVGQEAPQMASTVNLIAAGIGISLVPASMSHIRTQGVTYRPIAGTAPVAEMSLASRPEEARATVEAFVALATARAEACGRGRIDTMGQACGSG